MSDFKSLTLNEIAQKLKTLAESGKKLLILCHKSPDGDTIGSAFALKLIYEKLGGTARCLAPTEPSGNLKWMYSGQNSVTEGICPDDFDVVCAVDVASTVQLGSNESLAEKTEFMIDHHGSGQPFADFHVEADASAVGEIIHKLYILIFGDDDNDAEICRRTYGAISADTGSFRFTNTTTETMQIAAKLVGVINNADDGCLNTAEISRLLHETMTKSQLIAQKAGIEALKLSCDGKFAYIVFSKKMMEENGLCDLDLSRLIDIPRSVEGVEIAVVIKENAKIPGKFSVSSRSNGKANVAKLCEQIGGGGHEKAAGATVTADSIEAAADRIIPIFEKALK